MEIVDRFGKPVKSKPTEKRTWAGDIFEVFLPEPGTIQRVGLQTRLGTNPDGSPAGMRFGIEPELALKLAEALRGAAAELLKRKAEEKFGPALKAGPAEEEEVIP